VQEGHEAGHGGLEVWGIHGVRRFGHCGGVISRLGERMGLRESLAAAGNEFAWLGAFIASGEGG